MLKEFVKNHWGKTALGITLVVGVLGVAADHGLAKTDAYDLDNCESNPATFACQEAYKTAGAPNVNTTTQITDETSAKMNEFIEQAIAASGPVAFK